MLVILAALAAIAIALTLFFSLATETFVIPSEANRPAISPGDHVLMIKSSKVARNELVVFRAPALDGEQVIMRAVAIGGDRIMQQGNVLYINGKPAHDSYLPSVSDPISPMTVPQGMMYVLGDNRDNSRDSRSYGPVPTKDVVGHLVLCYWPLSRIGGL
jgi:signal peptidase I